MVKAYEGLPMILKLVLQLFFGWLISPVYRILKAIKKGSGVGIIVAILLHLLLAVVMWWVDLITILLNNQITVLVP